MRTSITAALLCAASGAVQASETRIANPQPGVGERFGAIVASSGDWLLVGAPSDSVNGVATGSVFVYALQNGAYQQVTRLTANDGAALDRFGSAISVDASIAVIGARDDDLAAGSGAGSAYVFELLGGTWTQTAKLVHPNAATADAFGSAVAVIGSSIVIGAPGDTVTGVGQSAGSAHVFSRTGTGSYSYLAQLLAADGDQFNRFGHAIALSSAHLLVGASEAEAVYAFERSNAVPTFISRLSANDSTGADNFGAALALHGNTAIIGAPLHRSAGLLSAGAAYIYAFVPVAGWQQQAKLSESVSVAGNQFGYSVALQGDVAAVGAHLAANGNLTQAGRVTVSAKNNLGLWSLRRQLSARDAAEFDELGSTVTISNEGAVIVGAPRSNVTGLDDAGSVVRFVDGAVSFQSGFE